MGYILKNYLGKFLPAMVVAGLLTILQVYCELKLPDIMSGIVDTGIVNGDLPYIMNAGARMIAWACGMLVALVVASFFASRAAMGLGRNIRSALYAKVSEFSLAEVDEIGTSSLITRTTNDVQQVERFIHSTMTVALMGPVMLVGAAAMAVAKSAELSTVIFVALPVLLGVTLLMMRWAMPLLQSLQRRVDNLNRITREGLTGIRVVRAYCREAFEEARFEVANRALADTNVAVARRMGAAMPVTSIILNFAIIAIVWFGAQLIEVGSLQVGAMMAIIQYASQALMSVMMLSMTFMILPRAMTSAGRIAEVLQREPAIVDAAGAAEAFEASGLDGRPHSVRFEDVRFAFGDSAQPVLDGLSFELEAGKTYALIGATGSGKTTIINLIERFLEPTGGRVLLDGVDVATIPQARLRELISYVPQRTVLFSGTLAENIAYGNEAAGREQIEEAARAAQAFDFIAAKPDGFETKITQAGSGLSGGQKQRIALARAFAKPAGLYIFDDSLSALDLKTDAAVRAELRTRTAGATVLIVAQRVAATMDADCVIVLDGGKVVGFGPHAELLESCQVYQEIVASQFSEEGEVA